MYAVVDIETSGGSSRNGKITEIAVILFDGEKITGEYSTLINPECKIPYMITRLTGIDDKMVRGAPKFFEVAKRIFEMTQDRIFVAHNVEFDYGFLKAEFKSLGGEFKRKKLCTVQMGRKFLPGKRSYSLGKLCTELGINNEARHRALGDARATTELFSYLLSLEGMNASNLLAPGFLKDLNTRVNLDIIRDLPEETGVYYFFDSRDELVYVGKSVNIKSRVISHLGNHNTGKALEMKQNVCRVEYEVTGSELVALLKESDEIKRRQPFYNRSQRRTYYAYGIVKSQTDAGYIALRLEKISPDSDPLISFSTREAAKEYLFRLVEKHELCQQISGLYHSSGPCFQYTIHQCRGACIGEESAEEFNYRAGDAIDELTYFNRDFVILDKGRSEHEKSVVMVENGVYKGFGFIDSGEQVEDPRQFGSYINNFEDNRDVQQIIRNYINSHRVEKIIEFG